MARNEAAHDRGELVNMTQKSITVLLVIASAYIAAQMLADIGSLKIITIVNLSMDAGTIIYPITFTLRDLLHKAGGIRAARTMIFAAGSINLLMAGFFALVALLPGDPAVQQADFGSVLSPVWRIVLASIAAEVLSELIDTEAYRIWVERVTIRYQWTRVLVSNLISIPLDSLVFAWLAFGGVFSSAVVWSIVLSNVLIKGVTTIIGMPLIYLVKPVENQ